VTSIAPDNLPQPNSVLIADESAVRLSTVPSSVPRWHRPDPTLMPRRFLLAWTNAHGVVGKAVRQHFDEHPHAVFTFVMPRSGEVIRAMWAAPPDIQWASFHTVASIAAEVEEVLAYE
jgi:hypothetical protein